MTDDLKFTCPHIIQQEIEIKRLQTIEKKYKKLLDHYTNNDSLDCPMDGEMCSHFDCDCAECIDKFLGEE